MEAPAEWPAGGHLAEGTPWAAGRVGQAGQVCSQGCSVYTPYPPGLAQVGCTELLLAPGLGDVHVYKAVCSWPGPKGHRKPEILPALVPPPHKK